MTDKTVVIVGPTASGKTAVAIEIAKAVNGEIISADSRAIYKGMDVGTAKPSQVEQQGVKHWGLDLVEPGERFTVADWKSYAEKKIEEIRGRGRVPIVVGGTGLYVDALVYDYQFGGAGGVEEGEAVSIAPDRRTICSNYLIIGVKAPVVDLRRRIEQRLSKLFVQELYDETRSLVDKYDWQEQAMKSNIYQYVWRYLQDELTLEDAKRLSFYEDWHLAKRQLTWFKRNDNIIWLPLANIKDYVLKCM